MAENASTVFNVHVPEFVDAIWVVFRCLTPRTNPRNERWIDTDSFTEDTNVSDDLDATSDASDGRITKHAVKDTSLSTAGSRSSFDSMDDSFPNGLIGIQDSVVSSNTTQYTSYQLYDSPRSIRSPYTSGKHMLSQRQDCGKVSSSVPASPLRSSSGSIEFVLEGEGETLEELMAESRMWERNARKLKIDLDFSKKESRKVGKCNYEVNYLKALLDESEVKEEAADRE